MTGLWTFFQWKLVLQDIALGLFYTVLKNLDSIYSLVINAIKKLSKSSMENSFCIWLSRNNNDYICCAANFKIKELSEGSCNSFSPIPPLKGTTNWISNAKSTNPVCLINRGNTCYVKSILQFLCVLGILWNRVTLESSILPIILSAIHRMGLMNFKNGKINLMKPVDQSNFLGGVKT